MHKLPKLEYDFNSLAPAISEATMQLHYSKHHQTYVDKLNAALEGHNDLQTKSVEELLANLDQIPESIRQAVINFGGGHYNHSLFWHYMSPNGGNEPTGELNNKIVQKYGSFQAFVDQFSDKATAVFGSGWAWLDSQLDITISANQDSLISNGKAPILGLDVWEHAYYVDYQNRRADYIKAWWDIVNWQYVSEVFENSIKS